MRDHKVFAEPENKLTAHQKLILEMYSGIVVWERWLAESRSQVSWSETEFHEFMIRSVKGMLKLWRVHLASQSAKAH